MSQTVTNVIDRLPERKVAHTAAGAISYREAGRGPVLLLLHGMNGNSGSWEFQLNAFANKYRVIAWDAPGYGLSDTVDADVDAYANQVAHLLAYLKIERTFIVGHSMGGVIAERYCARNLDRVACLALSGTHWGNASPPDAPLATKYARRLEDLEQMSADEYGQLRAEKMLPPSSLPEVLKRVAAVAAETRKEGILYGGQMVEKADNRTILPTLAFPVLVLSGTADAVVSSERSEAMLNYLPSGTAVRIPGVGHAAYLEAPDAFNRALEEFFRSPSVQDRNA
jgi:pimeloyl-ACP methyl ester carboxylesterase